MKGNSSWRENTFRERRAGFSCSPGTDDQLRLQPVAAAPLVGRQGVAGVGDTLASRSKANRRPAAFEGLKAA